MFDTKHFPTSKTQQLANINTSKIHQLVFILLFFNDIEKLKME